jgi:hypothetical protein
MKALRIQLWSRSAGNQSAPRADDPFGSALGFDLVCGRLFGRLRWRAGGDGTGR